MLTDRERDQLAQGVLCAIERVAINGHVVVKAETVLRLLATFCEAPCEVRCVPELPGFEFVSEKGGGRG